MIVQHNIMAINSHRQLGINNSNLQRNLEKLSSGYRINRAADDAAGLAISEKMRAQITALDRAVLNAKDGASLIQTAEGALQEVHGMLNRMVELATQSANGTIQADDRQKIEAELEALKGEIDRISEATNFNGIKLLDGSLASGGSAAELTGLSAEVKGLEASGTAFTYTAATAATYTPTFEDASGAYAAGDKITLGVVLGDGSAVEMEFTVATGKLVAADGAEYDVSDITSLEDAELQAAFEGEFAKNETLSSQFTIASNVITSTEKGAAAPTVSTIYIKNTSTNGDAAVSGTAASGVDAFQSLNLAATNTMEASAANGNGSVFEVNGQKFQVFSAVNTEDIAAAEKDGINALVVANAGTLTQGDMDNIAATINGKTGLAIVRSGDVLQFKAPAAGAGAAGTGGLTMQVGESNEDYQKITVSVDDMSSSGLGIKNISMATQEASAAALKKINSAIEKVSVNRGNLGALQNRLEHTINNLNVTSENMTAAESRIRDVDMAKEMMQFTKNNVLSQAAQAMLAQSNMQPQNVLQLLR